MRRRWVLGWGFVVVLACGDDGVGASDGSSSSSSTHGTVSGVSSTPTSADTGATDSTGDTSSTSADPTTTTTTTNADGSTTGDEGFACGDAMSCSAGDVCIEDVTAAQCTNLEDPEGECPRGQRMTNCGGAGIPCCCEPPPPPELRCVTPPEACADAPDCLCLGEVCTEGRECTALGTGPQYFRCEMPPPP